METLSSGTGQSWLTWFMRGILLLGGVVLFTRLAELQVVKGEYYRNLSEGNRIRRVSITAPRGKIHARGGEVIADNVPIEKAILFDVQEGYTKSTDVASASQDVRITEWGRKYPLGAAAGHLSGYLAESNEDEVGKVDPSCEEKGPRSLGSMIGRSGLELQYDCTLRGVSGEKLMEVDTRGQMVRILGEREPIPGQDVATTIDAGLQKKVADVMGDLKGAAVVTDVHGEVLAIYSSPSYDPNQFVTKDGDIQSIFEDPDLPLFNRVIGGGFHPASTFKIVTAAAALEEGKIDEDFTYVDTGVITVNDFEYRNWYLTQYGGTEGEIDVTRALARSTDTFFYKTGEFLGPDVLAQWARDFGLGSKTGIDLPGEIDGLVPDPHWKEREIGERWYLGNTYHMSIGQGDLLIPPLGVNMATNVIASRGKLCRPYVSKNHVVDCENVALSKETIEIVEKGLIAACSPGGTAFPFFDFTPQVACKTGTAETGEKDKTHAWLTVYGPVEDPEITVTVLVEKGGGGSDVAAPIARKIFDYYFHP